MIARVNLKILNDRGPAGGEMFGYVKNGDFREFGVEARRAYNRLDSHGVVDRKFFEIRASEVARHRG